MRRQAAGFTVLELLMTFVIFLIAMSIAGRLLFEARVRMAHSARQALDPAAAIAVEQIRADVRAASNVEARDFQWSWQPLVLHGHPAGNLSYTKEGSDLVRRIVGGDSSQRIVLKGTRVFRWRLRRETPLPWIEIELAYREHQQLGLRGGGAQVGLPITRTQTLLVGPRQAGGRTGW